MKDLQRPSPSSSYGSVYVPPHHRLRSVITTSAFSTDTTPAVVNNTNGNSVISSYHHSNGSNNSYNDNSNGNGNSILANPNSFHQQQSKVQVNGNGSVQVSDRGFEFSFDPGATTSDIDSWKWKLTTLLQSKDKQELVSREKKDRRIYEGISALATKMGLHSHLYTKVLVVSKVPLPNYRFDLDDKRPQREVSLPPGLKSRVDVHLRDYLSYKASCINGSQDDLFSRISSNGDAVTDEGLFDQPELPFQCQLAIGKVLQQRSIQLHTQQQEWQDSSDGWRMLQFRKSLPAYKEKEAIVNAILKNQVVIISGETGCGKTTQVPQFILESEIESIRGATCSIICTQPRRISAMSVSERIATERGEKLGETASGKAR